MDDDASPEVLETMGIAANIHEDDTIIPDGGKLKVGQGYASNKRFPTPYSPPYWTVLLLSHSQTHVTN